MFEVQEKSGFKSCDVEVAEHLGEVAIIESGDNLGIDYHGVIDDEIRDECADELIVVMDEVLFLLVADEALIGEFDDESTLIELFIETRLEGVEDLHGGTDYDFCECFVVSEHGEIF